MLFKKTLLKFIHKIYRKSDYVIAFFNANETILNKIFKVIERLEGLLHFNRLDEKSCIWWEKLLKITSINKELENRRAKIRAKFLACVHNDIDLLQKVCDSWKNGEIEADFKNGKIQLKFISQYGVPDNLASLKTSIEEVKPAHLPFEVLFKYLLIEDIHNKKTIEDMEKITLDMFAKGVEI